MTKIRQEINILNATITATSVGFAVLTTGNYSGTVTYQFEIVGRVTSGTATVTCQRNGTTTNDATISLSATSYTRLRATLTPPSGTTEYRVSISGGTGPQIRAARILVFQDASVITATETQIEIGGQETQLSTTNIALTAPKYWFYDSSKWDASTSFFVEVVGKRDTSTMSNSTWVLQEDNGSFGTWTDNVTIASAITTTTATDYKVAFTPVSGRNYRIVSRDSDTMNGGHVTYSAKIVAVSSIAISWSQVGNSLSISTVGAPALGALSSSRIAFIDSTNDSLRAYDFDGASWSQVGSSLAIPGVSIPTLAAMSSSRIAYIDSNNKSLRAYDFNGSTWSQVGNSFAISNIGVPSVCSLSSSRIAFIDDSNSSLTAYDFDGTNWSQVGNSLSISGGTDFNSICSLSSTEIAYIDNLNDQLRKYSFNGTNWSQVGNSLSISTVGVPAISGLSSSRVAFIDATNDSLRAYDFDGTNWSQVGNSLSISGVGNPALASLSSFRVVFIDSSNDSLRTYGLSGIIKIEPQYLLINQNITTTGLQDFDTLFDPADWSDVKNTYFHETNADGESSAVKLQTDPNGTPADISGSTATGANRQRTSALTMPTSSQTIDANVTTA